MLFSRFNSKGIVNGTREDCERFTIFIAWYHSATAEITSVVEKEDGTINLNINYDNYRMVSLDNYLRKYNLIWV